MNAVSRIPTNGAMMAFPVQAADAQGSLFAESGLTKREYFAATALAGILASPDGNSLSETGAARIARRCADALLVELTKPVQP